MNLSSYPHFQTLPVNISGHSIQLYLTDPSKFTDKFDLYNSLLNRSELQRSAKFLFDKDRIRYILCRGMLRELLGSLTETQARKITFSFGEKGKPYILEPDNTSKIFFNVSHSDDFFIIAVSMDAEVGVDIEKIRNGRKMEDIILRFGDEEAKIRYSTLRGEERLEYFYKWFTRKEAQGKALGVGLKIFSMDEPGLPETKSFRFAEYYVSVAVSNC